MKQSVVTYVVTWREWQGIEPCGKTEWDYKSAKFNNEESARNHYYVTSLRHSYVKLRKITEELLEEKE